MGPRTLTRHPPGLEEAIEEARAGLTGGEGGINDACWRGVGAGGTAGCRPVGGRGAHY